MNICRQSLQNLLRKPASEHLFEESICERNFCTTAPANGGVEGLVGGKAVNCRILPHHGIPVNLPVKKNVPVQCGTMYIYLAGCGRTR